jgi:PleD family two-component response regulator
MKNLFMKYLTRKTNDRWIVKNEQTSFEIHKPTIFHKLIEMERDRAHRGNQSFSMILININQENKLSVAELVSLISGRVRRIDQIGWYDLFHIGVLLPCTTSDGASSIIKDICAHFQLPQASFHYQTLSYPGPN